MCIRDRRDSDGNVDYIQFSLRGVFYRKTILRNTDDEVASIAWRLATTSAGLATADPFIYRNITRNDDGDVTGAQLSFTVSSDVPPL